MNRAERAVALVEAVAVLPVCVLGALALVDCGGIVRDRIAVAQAATRAAEASMAGTGVEAAAEGALPERLAATMQVEVAGGRVVVRAESHPVLLQIPGGVSHRSDVKLDPEVTA